jgi:hypothetical protein
MSTQINLKLSDSLFARAKKHAEEKGYENVQEFIRQILREKFFGGEGLNGIQTYLASERSLAKNWLVKEEDSAWEHLQKET